MKKILLGFFVLALAVTACTPAQKTENPLFSEFNTPFNAPPFDLIDNEHYLPAFVEAIKQREAEIDAIVDNPEPPTFENTILAYDRAGHMLSRISPVFYGLNGANTNPRLQEIAREITPITTAHYNKVRFNEGLFARIQEIYETRETLGLDNEQMRLVEKMFNDFARNGAALPAEQRQKLTELSERMSMISLELSQNILAENNGFTLVIEDEADLAGLPQNVINAAAQEASKTGHDGKWVFTLANPSWTPFLQFSERRELREKLYTAVKNRGNNDNENDNKALFLELMQLRREMANMLGYKDYAAYFISEQMAETPQNVYDFLYQIWEPAIALAKKERDMKQTIIKREGGNFELAAWDWWYYAEKIRDEFYDMDEEEVKPYFTNDNVRNGNFVLANKLFGLTFVERPEVPVYHEEVEAWEVIDKDGSSLGILYIDVHPRPGKRSGAWCGTYRSGYYDEDGNRITPIVTIVMNFSRPTGDKPAMFSWDETNTYFHEFGHALHNFFADGRYNRTSRSVPRDFVELPSQVLENWVGEPELLKEYAFHYETGEVIPNELVEKLMNAQHFNAGFTNVEYLASAFLDMDWHTTVLAPDTDVIAFEQAVMDRIGNIPQIMPRHRTTHFGHIFGTGYAAGYYVYRWAGVLDADAFEAFKESGDLFNPELAEKFRKYILAGNAHWEGMEAYVNFRGKTPDIDAFLRQSGLK